MKKYISYAWQIGPDPAGGQDCHYDMLRTKLGMTGYGPKTAWVNLAHLPHGKGFKGWKQKPGFVKLPYEYVWPARFAVHDPTLNPRATDLLLKPDTVLINGRPPRPGEVVFGFAW